MCRGHLTPVTERDADGPLPQIVAMGPLRAVVRHAWHGGWSTRVPNAVVDAFGIAVAAAAATQAVLVDGADDSATAGTGRCACSTAAPPVPRLAVLRRP